MQKLVSTLCALILVVGLINPLAVNSQGNEVIQTLSREVAEAMLLQNNATILGLEVSELELLTSFNDLIAAGENLETIYDQLPRYQTLESKYTAMSEDVDYFTYFTLLQIPEDSRSVDQVASILTYEAIFTAEDYASVMTVTEYDEYMMLKGMFAGFGFTSSSISDEDLYDSFIYTMDVAPLALQTAIKTLQWNAKVVEGSLAVGMNSLYDSLISLQGTASILNGTMVNAVNAAELSDGKLALGLVTLNDNRIAHIDAELASLEYEKMQRQMDSLMLSLKAMIGLDPSMEIVLSSQEIIDYEQKALEVYIEAALDERNEILIAEYNVMMKKVEINEMDHWFESDDERLNEVEAELLALERDLFQVEKDIEENVIKAYNNLLMAELSLTDAKLALEVARNDYEITILRSEMGYIKATDLTMMSTPLRSAENTLTSAINTYNTAVRALENAVSIGPGY